jgi:hypothetical protein
MLEELKADLPVLNLLRQVFLKEPSRDLLEGISTVALPADEDGGPGGW